MDEAPFWRRKPLEKLSHEEWESLCDGCARCCLVRLRDDETEEVLDTNIACRLLDRTTCRCMNYSHRLEACARLRSANDRQDR